MKACNSCGKCCIKYGNGGLSASAEDLKSWDLFRPELLEYTVGEKIWMDPKSGQQIERCPWLEKDGPRYTCAIYYDRPEDCSLYPASIGDMINDECEMLEAKDIKDPKQAEQELQRLAD